MADKSKKLYKDSPAMGKDENGKPGISKPTPADAEDMGVAGDAVPGSDGEMAMEVHQTADVQKRHTVEMKDMHKRHTDEMGDMHKRHLKEISKIFTKEEDK